MTRLLRCAIAGLAVSFTAQPSLAADAAAKAPGDDARIYEAFLDTWTGKDHAPLNVARAAAEPSAEDVAGYTRCVEPPGKRMAWNRPVAVADLAQAIHLPYIRFVDGHAWKPDDPGDRIRKGESVDSAVAAGFAHGLLTLSAISYDASGKWAALTYAFVCGELCGNGGAIVFEKSAAGWVRSKKSCGGWVS